MADDPAGGGVMTRQAEEAAAFEARALHLATEALHGAMLDDWPRVETAAKTLNEELGGEGVHFALIAWCDTLIMRQQELMGRGDDTALNRPAWVNLDSGEVALDADDVPVEVRWAGRLVAARAALDQPAWNALISVIPHQPIEGGQYFFALLSSVAETHNVLNRMERENR